MPRERYNSIYTATNYEDTKKDQLERIARALEEILALPFPGGSNPLRISVKDLQWSTRAVAGSGLASDNSLTDVPFPGSAVQVVYNGSIMTLGNGSKTNCSFYFSSDGGQTAKTFFTISQGDQIYFNAGFAGFPLEANEKISIYYLTFNS